MSDFIEPSLLPPPLRRDLNLRALETGAARLSALDLSPLLVYDLDRVPESLLPHLAEQFNVLGDAGWDVATTEAKRRALVQAAISLHKLKGTPYAVRRALDLIGVVALITEWWERVPKGTPHTFTVAVSLKDQPVDSVTVDAVRLEKIQRAVAFWKPVRSHFSMAVIFDRGATLGVQIASVFSGSTRLESSGALLPFEVSGRLGTLMASIATPTTVLQISGSTV